VALCPTRRETHRPHPQAIQRQPTRLDGSQQFTRPTHALFLDLLVVTHTVAAVSSIRRVVPDPAALCALCPVAPVTTSPIDTLHPTYIPTYTQTPVIHTVPYHTIHHLRPDTTRHDPIPFHIPPPLPPPLTTASAAPHAPSCALPPSTRAPLRKGTAIITTTKAATSSSCANSRLSASAVGHVPSPRPGGAAWGPFANA